MLPTRNAVAQALHRGTAMFDLRYALRQLARSPGFAAVALLTLTLGMGANTAFFSVLYGVVLRQPPYPGAERLVTLHNALAGATANGGRLSPAEFRDYRDRQRAFEGIATADLGRMTLTSSGEADAFAERVKVSRVTPELFPILGVAPARGRGTRTGDERAAIAVVSHELWRSRFGGADDILQRTIRLNGVEYAIVGVMPAGFAYPEPDMGAWLPIDLSPRGEVGPHRSLPRRRRAARAWECRRPMPAWTCSASPVSSSTTRRVRIRTDAQWSIDARVTAAEPVRPHAAAARRCSWPRLRRCC